ncbi:MAG: GTP-binding protein, partial [Promethearchaeota archaeon]
MSKEIRSMKYKVLLLGDGAVGKTSTIQRFIRSKFAAEYKLTVGLDIMTKDIELDDGFLATLSIWDLGGQERFSFIRPTFYKGVNGALLIYDITRLDTFNSIKVWVSDLLKYAGPTPIVLLGNKVDLTDARVVSTEMGTKLSKELNCPFFETSAKTGENIDTAFTTLIKSVRDKITKELTGEEFKELKRKEGIYEINEINEKIKEADNLFAQEKFFEAAEIYRHIADTCRLERGKETIPNENPMLKNALKYYEISANTYIKAEKNTEAAWSFEHLRSLHESIGNYDISLKSYIKSAENYALAGNLAGAAWRYSDIARIYESDFEFENAFKFNNMSWENFLKSNEFSLILEPIQKLSLYYERNNEPLRIKEIWTRSVNEAIKAKNYFWAGQISELYVNSYCPPENKNIEYEKTFELYKKAANKFKSEKNLSLQIRSLIFAAKIAIQLNKINEVKEIYKKVLSYYEKNQIWHQAARIATILGNHEVAVKYYKKEVRENNNSFYEPYLYISIAEYHVILKEHEKSIQNFKLALDSIQRIFGEDMSNWKKDELSFLQNWTEARIFFQEGVKSSEIDNHSKAQENYKKGIDKFENGLTKDISEEKRNLLRAFINLCNGLHSFEEMQKLEQIGDFETAKKQKRMFNFNLNHANANFIKAGQFNISILINSILEAVEQNEFSIVKSHTANIFPSFQPISTQKLSRLGLVNAYLKCSINDIKPLQVNLNNSVAISIKIGIDDKFFKETKESWLPLSLSCSNTLFSPINTPLTLTKQLTEFDYVFTPKLIEPGETTIKIKVEDINHTTSLKFLESSSIKVLRKFIPLQIKLIIENENENIFSSFDLNGPITQKIKPIKSHLKTSELLKMCENVEDIVKEPDRINKLKELGLKLWNAIIPENINQELYDAINFANEQEVPIVFMVSSSRNLMAVPYELLNSNLPVINGFLSTKFPIYRHPTEKRIIPIQKLTSRIGKVLLISANPYEGKFNLPGVDIENKRIQELLFRIGIQSKLISSDHSTLQNILQELLVNEYDAIHFSGHGYFDTENPINSGLILGIKGKSPEFLTANNIRELLNETNLKLIFLNSCYSATQTKQFLSQEEILGL